MPVASGPIAGLTAPIIVALPMLAVLPRRRVEPFPSCLVELAMAMSASTRAKAPRMAVVGQMSAVLVVRVLLFSLRYTTTLATGVRVKTIAGPSLSFLYRPIPVSSRPQCPFRPISLIRERRPVASPPLRA